MFRFMTGYESACLSHEHTQYLQKNKKRQNQPFDLLQHIHSDVRTARPLFPRFSRRHNRRPDAGIVNVLPIDAAAAPPPPSWGCGAR